MNKIETENVWEQLYVKSDNIDVTNKICCPTTTTEAYGELPDTLKQLEVELSSKSSWKRTYQKCVRFTVIKAIEILQSIGGVSFPNALNTPDLSLLMIPKRGKFLVVDYSRPSSDKLIVTLTRHTVK